MVRRREASRKTRSSLSERLAQEAKPILSKSSVRRQKQRAREQLAGNREGLQAMAAAVTSVESTIESTPREPGRASHSKNTARSRRAMLERERQRQPHILADLQRQADPFAALRTHVRNTLDLAPRTVRETDEAMSDT
ncbi:hypothetical protein MCAP1_003554 [Malassezia caprae]|uniref:Ribosome biogenesis protein SLX9 n=1 Tax=Malassezia caprae TaxID=1381934 RepID=A0AAF0IYD5_9BASI|nr:hypothetical protein MCAP1_003554 [Malassezia caprae]